MHFLEGIYSSTLCHSPLKSHFFTFTDGENDNGQNVNLKNYFKERMTKSITITTAKITSFSECFISCFSCLAQGSAVSLPYH